MKILFGDFVGKFFVISFVKFHFRGFWKNMLFCSAIKLYKLFCRIPPNWQRRPRTVCYSWLRWQRRWQQQLIVRVEYWVNIKLMEWNIENRLLDCWHVWNIVFPSSLLVYPPIICSWWQILCFVEVSLNFHWSFIEGPLVCRAEDGRWTLVGVSRIRISKIKIGKSTTQQFFDYNMTNS